MRKQGEFFLKLTSILMAVLLVAYIVFSLALKDEETYTLVTARYCEVGDGVTVSGFVVRQEEVLVSGWSVVSNEIAEGKRVGSGQLVATGYLTAQGKALSKELRALESQRAELQQAIDGTGIPDRFMLETEIGDAIIHLSQQTGQGEFTGLQAISQTLTPLVLRSTLAGGDTNQLKAQLAQLDERTASIEQALAPEAMPIYTTNAGYFSLETDGYEGVLTPERIKTISLPQLNALAETTGELPTGAFGRLITDQRWYYVTQVPTAILSGKDIGDVVEVSFPGCNLQGLTMQLERVGQTDGENTLLVLTCNQKIQNVTALRRQTANIVFRTYEGLLVPKTAITTVDGQKGVYVLEGAKAQWKEITILTEHGRDYLVEWDDTDTDNLWPQDEIIITEDEITDGKVMES